MNLLRKEIKDANDYEDIIKELKDIIPNNITEDKSKNGKIIKAE